MQTGTSEISGVCFPLTDPLWDVVLTPVVNRGDSQVPSFGAITEDPGMCLTVNRQPPTAELLNDPVEGEPDRLTRT
jgi:hypothetical protein